MRFLFSCALLCFALCSAAWAADLHFPILTGHVVDDAHVLNEQTVSDLEQKLAAYEQQTSTQIVVVTIPTLADQAIEDYGYQLGRHWGIGQKGKDNGLVLLVAPKEHQVRIEVGYGLEGVMTDAESSTIIHNVMLPLFKQGDNDAAVAQGTDSILNVLGGVTDENIVAPLQHKQAGTIPWGFLILLLIFFLLRRRGNSGLLGAIILGGLGNRSSNGGFSGFSGGGGSFGGGGASGSW